MCIYAEQGIYKDVLHQPKGLVFGLRGAHALPLCVPGLHMHCFGFSVLPL